jgi:hypothetical protein
LSIRHRRGQLAQVVALATSGIEATDSRVSRQIGQHRPAHRSGNRLVKARREKTPPRRDHLLAVARIARAFVLHRQQVGVALAGDIETVAGGAGPGGTGEMQGRTVERTGERLKGRDVHRLVSC